MKVFYDYKDAWLCVLVGLAIAIIAQYVLMPVLGFWPAMAFVALLSAIGARITLAIVESRDARDKGEGRAS